MNSMQLLGTNLFYPHNSYTDCLHQTKSSGFYRIDVGLDDK